MKQTHAKIHLAAAILFSSMALLASFASRLYPDISLHVFADMTLGAAILAWILFGRARFREKIRQRDQQLVYPLAQARMIEKGRLPICFRPDLELRDYEYCHFAVNARRVMFEPLPADLKIDPSHMLARLSGGSYYYIIRPQEILLPATPEQEIGGELIVTSRRIIFRSDENGFEVLLHSLKLLDCSANLVDFQTRSNRYTIMTDAAPIAEKVLLMLLSSSAI